MLADKDRFSKKAASFVIRTLAKHSADAARTVVDAGSLDALVTCLEEFDPQASRRLFLLPRGLVFDRPGLVLSFPRPVRAQVKESAAWALGFVARHNTELAQNVADAGAIPLLILALQEPEISLKRIAASTLSDLCKHTPELAQTVVDAGAIAYLAPLIDNKDAKLKRQVFSALSQVPRAQPRLLA